ncbi:SusD family protein [Chitinophaga jiangningensis]|uniref:SusD family protein n=1 Tax=Chitinophaga jiangningensis TaxID=1419482 RepID=A0A1M6VSM7_9BACT|nr:RagB/SusD family nutrient uptake outer membrane protein [Chitinophaga jiangningensis]SHK84266.1 SusD family protein [Chitinophaga jiangningensis]
MKKISIYTLLLAMGLASCSKDDLLNPIPAGDMPDYVAFQTKDRIASLNNGLYTRLKDGRFLGGKFQIANEVRAEDYQNELSNSVTFNLTWRRGASNETQEVKEIWNYGYLTINNANLFLDGMNAGGGSKVVGDDVAKVYIGEAKFVRALSYFSLLQLYARPYWDGNGSKPGLIIYTEGNKDKGSYQKARSTVAETYTQILKDLDEAEAALPKASAGSQQSVTHANFYSVVALKMRVYLHMGQYDKVVAEGAKIVSAAAPFVSPGGHGLQADVTKVFQAPYTTNESIFSLPFTSAVGDFPGTQTQLGYYFAPNDGPYGGNGEYTMISTGIVSDAGWKATDARRAMVYNDGSDNYMTKFGTPSPYTDWVPVLRYAEVLLNLAEAKARLAAGVDAGALELLNVIRHRSDPTTTFVAADFATKQDLINAITKEKHIELLGEGFRGMEVTRLGLPFVARGGIVAVDPTAAKYIYPISSDELVYNKLCVDNQ